MSKGTTYRYNEDTCLQNHDPNVLKRFSRISMHLIETFQQKQLKSLVCWKKIKNLKKLSKVIFEKELIQMDMWLNIFENF